MESEKLELLKKLILKVGAVNKKRDKIYEEIETNFNTDVLSKNILEDNSFLKKYKNWYIDWTQVTIDKKTDRVHLEVCYVNEYHEYDNRYYISIAMGELLNLVSTKYIDTKGDN
jgi:hypothetical protein